MAFNLGAAGLSFVGKDDGLSSTLDAVNKKFVGLEEKLRLISEGAKGMGARFGGAVRTMGSIGSRAIGGVAGALDNMAQRALNPKIDDAFASMHAQFAKTWGEVTVGMSMTAKESKGWYKAISGVAFSLNADMGATAQSWAEWRKQGLDLAGIMGKRNMAGAISELIKVTSVLKMDGQQLALMFSDLTKSWGFTTKEARRLTDTVFVMGKTFGIGQEMMQELPGTLQLLGKELAQYGMATKKNIEPLAYALVKVGIGFQKTLGVGAKEAMQASQQMFTVLNAEKSAIHNMFRGFGGDIGEIAQMLGERGGIHKAMGMLQADPAKFMTALGAMAKEAQAKGGATGLAFQRLVKVINEKLGPSVLYGMTGNWDKAAGAMTQLDAIVAKGSKNIGAMSRAANKSYSSGRTAGDAYNIMLQQQEARLMALSAAGKKEWIKSQAKGFDKFYGVVAKMAADKGPLGEVTRKLLLVKDVGLSGLFGGASSTIMKLIGDFTPLLTAFAAFGVSLMAIGAMLAPGGIILIGLALFHKGIRDKVIAGAEKAFKYLGEKLPGWWKTIKEGLGILWQKAVEGVNWGMSVATPMLNKLASAISSVDWGGLMGKLLDFIGKMARGIFGGVSSAAAGEAGSSTTQGKFMSAGQKLVQAIGKGMLAAAKAVLSAVWGFFTNWSGDFGKDLENKGKLLGGLFVMALFFSQTRALALQGAWMIVKIVTMNLIVPIMVKIGAFFAGLLAQQGTYWAVAVGAEQAGTAKLLGMRISMWFKTMLIEAKGWISLKLAAIGGWISRLAAEASGWIALHVAAVGGWITLRMYDLAGWLSRKAQDMAGWGAKVAIERGGWLAVGAAAVIGWTASKAIQLSGWAVTLAANAAGWLAMKTAAIAGAAQMGVAWAIAFGPVTLIIAAVGAVALALYVFRDKLSDWGKAVGDVLAWPFRYLWSMVKPIIGAIKALFTGDFLGFFNGIKTAVKNAIGWPFEAAWKVIKWVVGLIGDAWNALRDRMGKTGKGIMDVVSAPFRAGWQVAKWAAGGIKAAWNGTATSATSVAKITEGGFSKAFESINLNTVKMGENTKNVHQNMVNTSAQASGLMVRQGAQTVTETNDYWSRMSPHFNDVFKRVLTTSTFSNNEIMKQGSKASKSVSGEWGVSGEFVGKVWGVIGKTVMDLWDGIATGAMASSEVVIKAALAQAQALKMPIDKMQALEAALKDVAKMREENLKLAKGEKAQRELNVFDLGEMAQGAGLDLKGKFKYGEYAGKDIRSTLEKMSTSEAGEKEKAMAKINARLQADRYRTSLEGFKAAQELAKKGGEKAQKAAEAARKTLEDAQKGLAQSGVTPGEALAPGGAELASERIQTAIRMKIAKRIIAENKAYADALAASNSFGRKVRIESGKAVGDAKAVAAFNANVKRLTERNMASLSTGAGGPSSLSTPTLNVPGMPGAKAAISTGKAGVTGVATGLGAEQKVERKVSMTVSDDTKKVMANIADTVENLAAAIKNLGSVQVTVVIQGDLRNFLTYMQSRGKVAKGGNLSAAGQSPATWG